MRGQSAASAQRRRAEGRPARVRSCCSAWGGVTIAYRRRLIDSPSYTLNHEEVGKALEEGIRFAEGLTPARVEVETHGAVAGAPRSTGSSCGEDGEWSGRRRTLHGGAHDLRRRGHLAEHGRWRARIRCTSSSTASTSRPATSRASPVKPAPGLNPSRPSADVLLSRLADGRFISFFGDLHPSYFGNVVKAMASSQARAIRASRGMLDAACAGSMRAATRTSLPHCRGDARPRCTGCSA